MEGEKHIAVIRLSAMGDVAMTVPVIKAFVYQNPTVKITVISKPFLKPLFNNIPNVYFLPAEVTNKHKGIVGLFRLFKELKKQNITHFADLHNVLRSKILRIFFYFSKIKVASINKGRKEKKELTRTKNKVFKQLKTTHQRYADVFKSLGFSISLNKDKTTKKPIVISDEILKLYGKKEQKWIGIAPFATYDSKTYPLDLIEVVIKKLSDENYKLFLFGGKKEQEILEQIAKKYKNVLSTANKLASLHQELELISYMDCMLSMDSGNAHFAAIKNVKTITLWGATHPFAGFAPYKQPLENCITPDLQKFPNLPCSIYGNKTCKGYENVMRSIKPETVVNKVKSIL